MLVELKVGGLHGSIEFRSIPAGVSGRTVHTFDSYIARVTWGHQYTDEGMLYNWRSVAKSFGNGTQAENWLLDQLENPSFFILQNT